MMEIDALVRMAKCRELMDAGASIFYPQTCVIDADVEVGPDTVIEPFVQLLGRTRIGSDCRIRSYSVIQNSEIGDRVTGPSRFHSGRSPRRLPEPSSVPTRTCGRAARSEKARTWAISWRPRRSNWARDRRQTI